MNKKIIILVASSMISVSVFTGLMYTSFSKPKQQIPVENVKITSPPTATQESVATPVYDRNNILIKSNITSVQANSVLEDTGLKNLGQAYVDAEKNYGINAIFLIGLTFLESARGTSKRSKLQNNISGYAVYKDSSKGTNFESKEVCIDKTAKLLSEQYTNSQGDWYNGLASSDINIKYSADKNWSTKIDTISEELIEKIENI